MLTVRRIRVIPLAIPMRLKFEHAAAARSVADPVLVELSAGPPHDGLCGWGETLARTYVTGESAVDVAPIVESVFAPILEGFQANSFEHAVELAETLPFLHDGRRIHATRAAVELAWLDLAGRAFGRRAADAAESIRKAPDRDTEMRGEPRYSGIVIGSGTLKLKSLLRLQRLYGLRDFKVKVAIPGWERRVEAAYRCLASALSSGRATLRADANGGWTLAEALAAIPLLEACQIAALEQPLAVADDAELPTLAAATRIPIMPDESLVSAEDAERLIALGARMLNIRIAKVGGLLPAWRMTQLALARGVDVQLGCLVGETSILTAAGRSFVEGFPRVRFLEGAFGRWLLKRDVVRRSLQFRSGGCLRSPSGAGLGAAVDPALVHALAAGMEMTIAMVRNRAT